MVIRYIIEAIARDGNAAICISPLPDGSLDEGSMKMLKEIGDWMRINGKAVYGSSAWHIPGEGEMIDGELKMLPGGKLGRKHAEFQFNTSDFRFVTGKNGALYAFCMTVPEPGDELLIKSLAKNSNKNAHVVKSINLLGYEGDLDWAQSVQGLSLRFPSDIDLATSVVFEIN
jgi:alpha-L-fucosidase